jgi:hypothetical protein
MGRPSFTLRFFGVVSGLSVLLLPSAARAQAWVPAKGEGAVSVVFNDAYVKYHRLPTVPEDVGHIKSDSVLVDFSYGLTDKVALDVALPFFLTKYNGTRPHPTGLDNGRSHGSFQDFRFALRYNVATGPLVVTPFVGTIMPSNDYEYFAHSAPGRQVRELMVGAFVARTLDPLWSGGFVQARYSYGFAERVMDISHNRSNLDLEVGYFITPSFRVVGLAAGQTTHGGIDLTPTLRTDRPDLFPHHDQITRDQYIRVGVGAGVSLTESFDLFGSIVKDVAGRNGHIIQRGISVGVTWAFGAKDPGLSARRRQQEQIARKQEQTLVRCVCQRAAS